MSSPPTPTKPDAAAMQAAASRVLAAFTMGESVDDLSKEEQTVMASPPRAAPAAAKNWKTYKYEDDDEAEEAVEGEAAQVVAAEDAAAEDADSPEVVTKDEGSPANELKALDVSDAPTTSAALSPAKPPAAEAPVSAVAAAATKAAAEAASEAASEAALAEIPPADDSRASGTEAVAAEDEGSDFEFEPPSDEPQLPAALADAPRPPMAETAQLLQRIGSIKAAADVRAWAAKASDAELMQLVSGVREVHASWLHADAAAINMEIQLAIAKQQQLDAGEREREQKTNVDEMRTAIQEQLSSAEGHLTTLAGEVTSLQAQLAAKNAEVEGLTSSLAQAILNQKVVAEAATKSKGRMSRG